MQVNPIQADQGTEYDVVVAGGGPAGATVATYMAMEGRRVLLLEKSHFPRHAIGESLLPSMMPILQDFGLIDAVEDLGFPRKTGGTFIWGKSDEPWDVFFSNNPFLPYPYAYHVDRAVFDDLLLKHAESVGVDVIEGAEVTGVIQEDGRVQGVTWKDEAGSAHEARGHFTVDASGRASVIGRRVSHRQYDDKMRQVAFYTYYNNVKGPCELREGHVIIESCPRGWFWYIPLHGSELGDASVGLVTGQEFKEEVAAIGKEAFYAKALEEAPQTKALIGDQAVQSQKTRAIVDWAYTCDNAAGPGYFLIGDAAAFLDPMLSTGVSIAMLAGYSASVCMNTLFEEPELETPAMTFFNRNYQRMYEVTRDFLHYFYACNGRIHHDNIFWQARKALQLDESVAASQAFCFLVNTIPANPHPALNKQIHMYQQFMDQLEHPEEALKCDASLRAYEDEQKAYAASDSETPFDDSLIPVANGELESSFIIDGDTRRLKPVQGIAYDADRPIFSSTSSWLLGRNLHQVDDVAAEILVEMDGKRTWRTLLEDRARTSGQDYASVRRNLEPVLNELCESGLVLQRKAHGSTQEISAHVTAREAIL